LTLSRSTVRANVTSCRRDLELPSGSIVCQGRPFVTAPVTITRQLKTHPGLAGMPLVPADVRWTTRFATAQLRQANRDLRASPLGGVRLA